MMIPNRIRAPLTADEALAERHGDRLHFLREVAEARQQAREALRRAAGEG